MTTYRFAWTAALWLAPANILGQVCDPTWSGRFSTGEFDNPVYALLLFDLDGEGPAHRDLFAAGDFQNVGGVQLHFIARWDGVSWSDVSGGTNEEVYAICAYDADGEGPAPALLCAGGEFEMAGGVPASYIATWNGTAWATLGDGIDGPSPSIRALAAWDPDGPGPEPPSLYAAGLFATAGGASASNIARWNGMTWSPLGSGTDGQVNALAVLDDDGDGPNPPAMYVAGLFTIAGGVTVNRVARWDGTAWSAVSGGMNGEVATLFVFDPDAEGSLPAKLYAGGNFTLAGGVSTPNRVAAWDGTMWSTVGSGGAVGGKVRALASLDIDGPGPDAPILVVGGSFSSIGGSPGTSIVATFDPQSGAWSGLSGGMTFDCPYKCYNYEYGLFALCADNELATSTAKLYAGGWINGAGGVAVSNLASWSTDEGGAWSPIGRGFNGGVAALTVASENNTRVLYLGGDFSVVDSVRAKGLVKWDGQTWTPIPGSPAGVRALAIFDDDAEGPNEPALYVGGSFSSVGGVHSPAIAKWDGASWLPLGSGLDGTVFALAVFDEDGNGPDPPVLFAGGTFTNAGGIAVTGIAKWDGTFWWPVGSPLSGVWSPAVYALTIFDPDGSGAQPPALVAGGIFQTAGGTALNSIAELNPDAPSGWSSLGAGLAGSFFPAVYALTAFDDGVAAPRLYAGGLFTTAGGLSANRIACWNPAGGGSWSALGVGVSGNVRSLAVFDEDGAGPAGPVLFVGGEFLMAGGLSASRIARWNPGMGGSWSTLGTGANSFVLALSVFDDDGDGPSPAVLCVGGNFTKAGGQSAGRFEQWGCPGPSDLTSINYANPPTDNPFLPGVQPFRDVLQNATPTLIPQGIGIVGTPSEASYSYAPISVVFADAAWPIPTVANIGVNCTDIAGNGPADCPTVASVAGSGAGPYAIILSGPIPPRECITFTFAGTDGVQQLQYQSLPGDVSLDGVVNTQDLIWLIQRMNDGSANLASNLARYDVNRSTEPSRVNTLDLLRLVQLLNGTNATQAFNGATVASCP
ncbi:MAG TPA: dockerin type I domain-containing protein [Phycisphaerae bacterium]|jgi:hypothetical protein